MEENKEQLKQVKSYSLKITTIMQLQELAEMQNCFMSEIIESAICSMYDRFQEIKRIGEADKIISAHVETPAAEITPQ